MNNSGMHKGSLFLIIALQEKQAFLKVLERSTVYIGYQAVARTLRRLVTPAPPTVWEVLIPFNSVGVAGRSG